MFVVSACRPALCRLLVLRYHAKHRCANDNVWCRNDRAWAVPRALERTVEQQNPVQLGRLESSLGYRLRQAQLRMFTGFNRLLAPYELTPGLYRVLVLIEANPGMNQTALSLALGVDRSTVVGVIDKLESPGWVKRSSSGTDRRAYALVLTRTGESLLQDVAPIVDVYEKQATARLTDGDRQQLMRLLPTIAADLSETEQ